MPAAVEAVVDRPSQGQPLDLSVRRRIEPHVRTDLGRVRVRRHQRDAPDRGRIDVPAAKWLVEKEVTAIGVDNMAVEVLPNPDHGLSLPVHQYTLADAGTPHASVSPLPPRFRKPNIEPNCPAAYNRGIGLPVSSSTLDSLSLLGPPAVEATPVPISMA